MERAPAFGLRGPPAPGRPVRPSGHGAEAAPLASAEPLLAAIAAHRDREAFRQLFSAFAPRIKRYLCARGAAESLADEVVQEVMLKVWRKAHLYDPAKAGGSTWIYSVARNCMLDRVRSERRPEIEEDDPFRVAPTPPD